MLSYSILLKLYFSTSSPMTDGQSERYRISPTTSPRTEARNGDRVFFKSACSRTNRRWRLTSRSSRITAFHR